MHSPEYLNVIEWEQVHRDVASLSEAVLASGFAADLIVGIGYGGIVPATLMYFLLPETRYRVAYPKSSSNEGIESLSDIKGKKVLLVDDLAISGDSLNEIKRQVAEMGAKDIRAAVMYSTPDYDGVDHVVRHLAPQERIVFPWYCRPGEGALQVLKFKDRFGKHEPI